VRHQQSTSEADRSELQTKAAQYVRMSTEHQRYSITNQIATNAEYAAVRGMQIVRTYADEGKSGLRLKGRAGLNQLISDVRSGRPDFTNLLVYDVSRWGRFQDADEGAYYEFLCKQAGIAVHYCAELFENDGSLSATIIKGLKRAMAGEFTVMGAAPSRSFNSDSQYLASNGVCASVADVLRNYEVHPSVFDLLRRMSAKRQVEAAALMLSAGNVSSSYARALLAATRQDQLADPKQRKRVCGLGLKRMASMESEMGSLTDEFLAADETYGDALLNFVCAMGYVRKLIANEEIAEYLGQRHPEILGAFTAVVFIASPNRSRTDGAA
jgi:hypothetical protein